jgi:hypothetical protein
MSELESNSGGERIVWEVVYGSTQYTRHESGTVEWQTEARVQRTVHIIAPTYAMARVAFDHKYPARCDYEFVSATPLCTINYELEVRTCG